MTDEAGRGAAGTPMRRIVVHVGAPKTGTTGVQDTLWRNRGVLAEHGVHYPADRFDEHFLAALDLQNLAWGGLEREAVGVLDRLVDRVNRVEGTVVLSHEVFAAASSEQAKRLITSLDGEVHVVFSVRELARQVPAEWQELVKHRRQLTYTDFLDDLVSDTPTRAATTWFWSVQHWPHVLERWGATLPPERVHVITVPRPGGDRQVLVERFWRLFGVRSEWLTEESPRTNTGLDGPAATALRRLNERLPGERLASRHYRPLVREAIVHRGMGGRLGKPRITLPDSLAEWAAALTQEWIDVVQQCGYDVIGDFDELAAGYDLGPWEDPDDAGPDELLEAVEQMLDLAVLEGAELLDQVDTARVERDAARGQLEAAQAEAERLVADKTANQARADELAWLREHPVADLKRRVVDASASNRGLRSGLDVYRAARRATGRARREGHADDVS
jgi:hypothetical protein